MTLWEGGLVTTGKPTGKSTGKLPVDYTGISTSTEVAGKPGGLSAYPAAFRKQQGLVRLRQSPLGEYSVSLDTLH